MMAYSDRLAAAVQARGRLCVGLDPRLPAMPMALCHGSPASITERFCLRVLELVAPHAAIVKPQAAFFEELGPDGLKVLQTVLHAARDRGFFTVLDAKRGDIASTAEAYAEAAFTPQGWNADACTVNPYLGADAVEPFVRVARRERRGLFVLVRTSNPGSGLFQSLYCEGKPLYEHVAQAVGQWNSHGDVGAVVGATHPAELRALRRLMPNVWFLVPGYGAQGGTAADVAVPLSIVNSSRGITYPFKPDDPTWEARIASAAAKAQAELALEAMSG
jgi:orotidine-5'-phosphate decarboxylase